MPSKRVPAIINAEEKVEWKRLWPTAPSLKPGLSMIQMAARGNEEACAIRDAWAFRPTIRVTTRDEYLRMVERGSVTFHG